MENFKNLIGRKNEIEQIKKLYDSQKSEFLALYGRRRIGKTFLIKECFANNFAFQHVGLSPINDKNNGKKKAQLTSFYFSLLRQGSTIKKIPKTWLEAFYYLELLIDSMTEKKTKKVIFLDELPWMDTKKSGFMSAFESFWNSWASLRDDILLVVCGSATSWMLNNVINNHGGLYNRITMQIHLTSLKLDECEKLLKLYGINFKRYDIVQAYMIFGGVPYYYGYLDKSKSLAESIDEMFFKDNANLKDEFNNLFSSTFVNHTFIISLIRFLFSKKIGYTKKEILQHFKIDDSTLFTRNLRALISSEIIIKYTPFGESGKNERYKLIDNFSLFYLHFIEHKKILNNDFWKHNVNNPIINSWRGLAFENICFQHKAYIKRHMKIEAISSEESNYIDLKNENKNAQIDLLIRRADNITNICEIKFYSYPISVDKNYYLNLLNKEKVILDKLNKKESTSFVLITTFGIIKNEYSDMFTHVLTIDDLF